MPTSERPPLIRVEPLGRSFEAPAHLSLLEAATAAGVRLPRSCRNGTCRTCLAQLRGGTVSYRIEWPGLTKEEKAEGFVLPCVAIAKTNLILVAPGAEVL
ncbi:2Fe-2S iron-sulfur cluster-binding protein [Trinickia caryophylli]|uniref:Ferredoxin n=1 Tax=Trinickia caryophylli TaxID=28094 RepID=A0A1X7H981_TRICW|nr:2Fe-2S iron-sulfur cluster-binding protein [Trinickia caryophylli]PMS09044.1 (2Fe-2S)-binding protein [Trinickia caryophylli]TRX14865.1 2Fe-2S iron-sulfur cluster binding domain-containing protein [Trinickia caryophylli]WQE14714.1 2Fe-2S iron-sulfur cluster-binding protein [Trinickia caryophylli]SMF81789.1 Ferredoxin [Trinickia caryophylli]GLU31856.1 (2Fe-2S)-binding protein [Trinickia caryophylli]